MIAARVVPPIGVDPTNNGSPAIDLPANTRSAPAPTAAAAAVDRSGNVATETPTWSPPRTHPDATDTPSWNQGSTATTAGDRRGGWNPPRLPHSSIVTTGVPANVVRAAAAGHTLRY